MNTNVYIVKMMLYTSIKKQTENKRNKHASFFYLHKKILHRPYETIAKNKNKSVKVKNFLIFRKASVEGKL